MFQVLSLENRSIGFQFCLQISVNVLHVDGTSVIYITLPRLFSPLAATVFTLHSCK